MSYWTFVHLVQLEIPLELFEICMIVICINNDSFFSFLFLPFYLWNILKFPWLYQDIDGAYFGTTFPHLFLMTYGHLKPQKATQSYVPRVFGFKIHKPWHKKVQVVTICDELPCSFCGGSLILPHVCVEKWMALTSKMKCKSTTIDLPMKICL